MSAPRRTRGDLRRLTAADRRAKAARNQRRGRGAVPARRRSWRPKVERERLTITAARKAHRRRIRAALSRVGRRA